MNISNPNALSFLIIEDDEGVREAWELILGHNRGHALAYAVSFSEAKAVLASANPLISLIICDGTLKPSGEKGWDIIQNIRAWYSESNRPMPPVLATPGDAMPATIERWRSVGVEDVIRKPFDVGVVLEAITRLTQRS